MARTLFDRLFTQRPSILHINILSLSLSLVRFISHFHNPFHSPSNFYLFLFVCQNLKFERRLKNPSSVVPPKQKLLSSKSNAPVPDALTPTLTMQLNTSNEDDDDDFQSPSYPISSSLTQNKNSLLSSFQKPSPSVRACSRLHKPHSNSSLSKKLKRSIIGAAGKENIGIHSVFPNPTKMSSHSEKSCISKVQKVCFRNSKSNDFNGGMGSEPETSFLSILIDSRSMESSKNSNGSGGLDNCSSVELVENVTSAEIDEKKEFKSDQDYVLASIDSFEPIMSCSSNADNVTRFNECIFAECGDKKGLKLDKGYVSNSIESRLIASKKMDCDSTVCDSPLDEESETDFDLGTQLNVLMGLCSEERENENTQGFGVQVQYGSVHSLVNCPLCGIDISHLSEELRQVHTNDCLDRDENQEVVPRSDDTKPGPTQQVGVVSPVIEWLRSLGLSRYEEAFAKEEIDWDTLQWLTEEDLLSIGVAALGPRKKIVHALTELRNGNKHVHDARADASKVSIDEPQKLLGNKLITQYFPGSSIVNRKRDCMPSRAQSVVERSTADSGSKRDVLRNHARIGKVRDIPSWCCIPGTPFRVDAFRYLRRDCTHWFLSHFHIDHYQGLTRSFCHGKIYCSSITARLVHMKIGVPLDRLEVLPLNEKINIDGVDVTCLDANHCPGSVIILFEPLNGKAVLHTGDFRFSEAMANMSILRSCPIQTLILDTTYCNPQYDFPKQEAVIQFVIDSIQAEAFNPKTLFLIGSYTIGKERLFLEVARCLRKKVYVGAAKLHLLQCLGLPDEDMQWFTLNEQESHIHVVPMWTIASFKRMKHLSNQYSARYNLIVAFSPTGWTFGKGKKKSPGRRWKQGTIIRYEVPYSEHCSFTELKEFVQFISPENIVPSVNNDGPESADAMTALLMS